MVTINKMIICKQMEITSRMYKDNKRENNEHVQKPLRGVNEMEILNS